MKHKTVIIIISLLFFILDLSAQFSNMPNEKKEWEVFKTTTTYVVKSGDESFDNTFESIMKEVWTITPYKSITQDEFEIKLSDKSASFLLFHDYKTNKDFKSLILINGGEKKIYKYSLNQWLAYSIINVNVNEPKNTDCAYRLKNMIQGMLIAIEVIQKDEKIRGGFNREMETLFDLRNIFNLNAPKIKERILLVYEDSYPGISQIISSIYPYKYEICSKDKIEKVIKEENKDYYYLQPVIASLNYLFVIDPATGEVMYLRYEKVLGKSTFSDKCFKDLIEKIN